MHIITVGKQDTKRDHLGNIFAVFIRLSLKDGRTLCS